VLAAFKRSSVGIGEVGSFGQNITLAEAALRNDQGCADRKQAGNIGRDIDKVWSLSPAWGES